MDDEDLHQKYFDAEVKLNNLLKQELHDAITRSKIQWTEEGERSTKYFFGHEKSRAKKKYPTKLIDSQNNILINQRDISNHVVYFYQSLYSHAGGDQVEIVNHVSSSNLTSIDKVINQPVGMS
jgi:hypothetical protein